MISQMSKLANKALKHFEKYTDQVNDVRVTITIFKGKFNLCNAHNTIGSCNFVQNAILCSFGIQHADYKQALASDKAYIFPS